MLSIYFRTVLVCWKIYGFSSVFLAQLLIQPLIRIIAFITLFLDKIFFPSFRKKQVKSPIFIIGHPRSGTTFLHHLLTSTDEAVAFKSWHLLFPAISARILVRPIVDYFVKKGKTEIFSEETGHKVMLDKTEEEEMLFLHIYDTQFLNIGMLGFDSKEYPEHQWCDQQSRKKRFKSMRFIDGCFKRHILYTGKKQIIAQTHFSTHRLKTMLEFYPDAKFIYILRNPYHVVPSFLSLLHNSIRLRWGIENIPSQVLNRYTKRRYQAIIDLYRYFYDLKKNGEIPPDRVMILPYDLIVTNLNRAFQEIVDFTGLEVSDKLRRHVKERSKTQRDYQRKHQVMDLAHFGLTKEMIKKDFSFVFEEYSIKSDEPQIQ